jgi:hypothetical protein
MGILHLIVIGFSTFREISNYVIINICSCLIKIIFIKKMVIDVMNVRMKSIKNERKILLIKTILMKSMFELCSLIL